MRFWRYIRRYIVVIIAFLQLCLLLWVSFIYLRLLLCGVTFDLFSIGDHLPISGFVAVSQVTGLTSVLFAWLVSRGQGQRCGLPLTKLYRYACGGYWLSFVLFVGSTLWTIFLNAWWNGVDTKIIVSTEKWVISLLCLCTLLGLTAMIVTTHRFIFNETLCRMYAHEYWSKRLMRNFSMVDRNAAIVALAHDVGECIKENDGAGLDKIWLTFTKFAERNIDWGTNFDYHRRPDRNVSEYIWAHISFWDAAIEGRSHSEVNAILHWGLETLLLEYGKKDRNLSCLWSKLTVFWRTAMNFYIMDNHDPKLLFFFLNKELLLMRKNEDVQLTIQFLYELVCSYSVMWELEWRTHHLDYNIIVYVSECVSEMRKSLNASSNLERSTFDVIGTWSSWCYMVSQDWNENDWTTHKQDVNASLKGLELTWI